MNTMKMPSPTGGELTSATSASTTTRNRVIVERATTPPSTQASCKTSRAGAITRECAGKARLARKWTKGAGVPDMNRRWGDG